MTARPLHAGHTGVLTTLPSERDSADDLAARAAASEQRSRELACQVSRLAGEMAETELDVATSLEQIAADHRTEPTPC